LSRSVHQVLLGAELAEMGFDFSGGIVCSKDSGLALEGEAVGLERAVGSGDQIVVEAVQGLAMLAQAARGLEEQSGPIEGLELDF